MKEKKKDKAAAKLGAKGGKATLEKYGREHMSAIRKGKKKVAK